MLNTLIDSKTTTLIVIIAASVVSVALIVFLVFFFRKRKLKSSLTELKNEYNSLHTELVSHCKTELTRLETLGKASSTYQNFYTERANQYNEIYLRRDKNIENSLNSLSELIKSKNYKQAREVKSEIKSDIDAYSKVLSNFSSDLFTLLQEDNETQASSVNFKNMHRQIKEFYAEHKNELKDIGKSFEIILQSSEDAIKSFKENIDQAKYEEAKQALNEIQPILEETISVMDQLPLLLASISTVLPNKINDLEETYHTMIKEEYVVEHLQIENKVEEMRNKIEDLKSRIVYLKIDGIKDEIDAIQNEITDLNAEFNEEKNAKETFLKNQTYLSDSTFEMEQKYSKQIKQINEYQRAYNLDKKYVDQIHSLKDDIENIGILKHELDSYLDTSNRKPYTVITQKMSEMQNEMTKATRTMNDYQTYLDSLKKSCEDVHEGLQACYLSLKELYSKVYILNVDSYSTAIQPKFEHLFNEIKEISSYFESFPLDVTKIVESFSEFKEECQFFIEDVNKNIEQANKAEKVIVKANTTRLDFKDCEVLESQAEFAYENSDFIKAHSLASKALATFTTVDTKEHAR